MAEVLVRAELASAGLAGKVEVDSAGTGDWHLGGPMDHRARAELARHGHDGTSHRARQIKRSWLGRYDLIVACDTLIYFGDLAPVVQAARNRPLLSAATAGSF